MKALVLNLKSSPERRKYMNDVIKGLTTIQPTFIEAIDGRKLSNNERHRLFGEELFNKENGRNVRAGEIGCTLSHQKCYGELLKSNEQSMIIFEDDIIVNGQLTNILAKVEEWLNTDEPRVLLLSGWFWHKKPHAFFEEYYIAEMIDGLLTHAYALNKSAAQLMIDAKPWYLADAWEMFRNRGIKISGLKPHLFDQNWTGLFETTVNNETVKRKNKFTFKFLKLKFKGLRNKILKKFGGFEHPQSVPTIKI